MIYAPISELLTYTSIPFRNTIADFLRCQDLSTLPDGEHEIEGRNLYLRVFTYDTPRHAYEAPFEAHRADADLHVVLRGIERCKRSHLHERNPWLRTMKRMTFSSSLRRRIFRM